MGAIVTYIHVCYLELGGFHLRSQHVMSFILPLQLLKKSKAAILCGFLVSTMTAWKTLLFWMRTFPIFGGGHLLGHTTWGDYIFWIIIGNGLWTCIPAAFIYAYGKIILKALNDMKEKTV